MRVYTVHIADGPTGPAVADAVLVKEGFSWPGFFFSALWALWLLRILSGAERSARILRRLGEGDAGAYAACGRSAPGAGAGCRRR